MFPDTASKACSAEERPELFESEPEGVSLRVERPVEGRPTDINLYLNKTTTERNESQGEILILTIKLPSMP